MLFRRVLDLGVRETNQDWENTVIRKLNFLSIVGIVNALAAFAIYFPLGIYHINSLFAVIFVICPFVFYFNSKSWYRVASNVFFTATSILLFLSTWIFGVESMVYMYYFPAIFIMVFLVGRTEMRGVIIFNSIQYALSFFAALYMGRLNDQNVLGEDQVMVVSMFCTTFSFLSTLVLVVMAVAENIKLEQSLRSTVKEKEILLAEVFHRVKNNMSIVTGLLSIKRESATSDETKAALDECRSRVYSMATIHHLMVNSSDPGSLDFKLYIDEIVANLDHTYGESVHLEVHSVPVEMSISQAVPCGLIVNELVTNSYKHARVQERPLKIRVDIEQEEGKVLTISVRDNGPGLPKRIRDEKPTTLGFELVESLCDQIDASVNMYNDDGCVVSFRFTKK